MERKRGQIYFPGSDRYPSLRVAAENKSVPFFPASALRRKINLSPFSARRAAVLALLGAALCSTAGCGAAVCKDAWLGPDKARHFAAGFAISAGTSTLAGHAGWAPVPSAALGFGVVAAAGAVKETADLKGSETCWSWKDFAWDLLGGAVGTAVGTAAGH